MDNLNGAQMGVKESNATRFASWVMAAVAILLPIFFIPSAAVSLSVAKIILLSVGILASLAAVILSTIQNGQIRIPWNIATGAIIALPLVFLIASIFSPTPSMSLWGYGYETGTFGFIFLVSIAALISASVLRSKKKENSVLWGLLVVSGILGLFHLIRFFVGANHFSLGLFADNYANTVGGWNELSLWFGFTAILAMVILESLKLGGLKKIIAYASFVLSLILMFVINFSTAWYITGIFALIFLVYEMSRLETAQDGTTKRRIAWKALAIVIVALICILANSAISTAVSQKLNVASVEVRPSWAATFDVLKSSLSNRLLIGAGADNFTNAWLTYKPAGINSTIFWNTDFSSGIGLIPTFAVTTGLLGIIAWLFFLGLVVKYGIKLLFREGVDQNEKTFTASAVFGTLFLWTAAFVYVPSSALIALAFIFTGLMLAALYRAGVLRTVDFSLFSAPRASFVTVLVLIVVLIGVVSLGFLFAERAIAQVYFGKALVAANQDNDLGTAQSDLNKAIAIHPFDAFYRSLSNISMTQLSNLLQNQNASADAVRTGFQSLLSNAIQSAQLATQANPYDYQNWLTLAQVYASVVPKPFQIKDAYQSAKDAFTKAENLNPTSPEIVLSMARLESDNNNLADATKLADQATQMKPDYADAHFFLSQVAVAQGNLQEAINKTETTILLSPQNAGLYFQLGVLYFNVPDYQKAAQALEQAITILPDYANARYFLGLSLARTGDKAGAISQFQAIEKTNPDNADVEHILANLNAGKDPLAGLSASAKQPQSNPSLPLSGQ